MLALGRWLTTNHRLWWGGMRLPAWLRLLWHYRHGMRRERWADLLCISGLSLVSSVLAVAQDMARRRQIHHTRIDEPPLFVVGHWRSGTTLLHRLLALDRRHTYATTYDCFFPGHSLLTGSSIKHWMVRSRSHSPDHVVVDDWDAPQEDEFALCMLGQPSPYTRLAFPSGPPYWGESLALDRCAAGIRHRWHRTMHRLVQQIVAARPGRPLLKSPTHTARIRHLLKLFPAAKFVHIVRNPYDVIASTLKTRAHLAAKFSLQPTAREPIERVLASYRNVFNKLDEDRPHIPAGQFMEVRYEDLIEDTEGQLVKIYRDLSLGGWTPMTQAIRQIPINKPRPHNLTDEQSELVRKACWANFNRYGYQSALHPAA